MDAYHEPQTSRQNPMDRLMVQSFRLLAGESLPIMTFHRKSGKPYMPTMAAYCPGTSTDKIEAWYEYHIRTMKEYGFDFLKIDNQSFTLPLYMGGTQVIRQGKKTATLLWSTRHTACKWD